MTRVWCVIIAQVWYVTMIFVFWVLTCHVNYVTTAAVWCVISADAGTMHQVKRYRASHGTTDPSGKASHLPPWRPVTRYGTGTICGKGEEVAWWMESLGRFPRVLNVLPREKIEGPPRDFLKANPRPHPRPDKRPKPWRGPSIFFRGSTLSTEGTSRGLNSLWYLWGFPKEFHSFYQTH